MNDFGDIGMEPVAARSSGDRASSDRATGDLRLSRPLRLGTLDGVDRGAVQGESRIPSWRSVPFRASGIEPNVSSPFSNAASIPEIRGEPFARKVAIVLCL